MLTKNNITRKFTGLILSHGCFRIAHNTKRDSEDSGGDDDNDNEWTLVADKRGNNTCLEIFYLTTHSAHFILRLYGVRHMVEDHSDSERGRKEGNVLFNDTLNTFHFTVIWRQTYGRGPLK